MKTPLTLKSLDQCIPQGDAINRGFSPITTSYNSREWWMLENALASLGNRRSVLVQRIDGHEIWIPKSEKKTAE